MAAQGWISIHRKITECSIWIKNEPFDCRSAWIDLLLMANHKDKRIIVNGKGKTIHKGQRLTSTYILAERWHWSIGRVRRYLALLEGEGMITTERTTSGTILTIVKYGEYQIQQTTNDTTNSTTDGITVGTTDGITVGTQTIMNNNDNNENNENKGYRPRVLVPNDELLDEAINDYLAMRADQGFRVTDKFVDDTLRKLATLSGGDQETALLIVRQSLEQGWKGLFDLKAQGKKKQVFR